MEIGCSKCPYLSCMDRFTRRAARCVGYDHRVSETPYQDRMKTEYRQLKIRYDAWQDVGNRVYMPLDGFCSYGDKGMSNEIEINIYDREEIHYNCTVQVLTNSVTGEVSVGWWENEEEK